MTSFDFHKYDSPQKIEKKLNKVVFNQKEVIRQFSLLLYKYNLYSYLLDCLEEEAEYFSPSPIFLGGATGTGKTLLVQTACELVGLNFITIDASMLTSSGYYGNSFGDMVGAALGKLRNKHKEYSCTIIFIDELDKMVGSEVKHLTRYELLTFLSDKVITLRDGTDVSFYNAANCLIVLAGSFENHFNNSVGFIDRSSKKKNNYYDIVFRLFGAEFAGRIGHFIQTKKLETVKEYEDILVFSEKSPLVKIEKFLKIHGKKVEIRKSMIAEIAEKAFQRKVGARGLQQVVNEYFSNAIYEAANAGLVHRKNYELPF